MEDAPKKFFRLAPGREVRLRYAYFITCTNVIKDSAGNITELRCTYDPATRGGDSPDGRKVKSTLHWVCAKTAIDAEARLYEYLFTKENPEEAEEGKDFTAFLNPDSLKVLSNCKVEPYLKDAKPLSRWQFERLGYFCVDTDSKPFDSAQGRNGKLIFNRTATLRDEWAKIQKKQER
jgi:glutaminyl-tRNA synthetase